MQAISTEARTIYAQIADTAWSHPIVYGSFSAKKVKGQTFIYQQFSSAGSQKQLYLGEATGEMMAKVEAWKSADRYLRRLSAMAIQGGCLAGDRLTETALMRFAEAGWFAASGVLVGSHAFATLGNILGVRWGKETVKTQDVDMAADKHIGVAIRPGIGRIIEEMGYAPVPSFNHKHPPTSFILRGGRAKID
jgi:hypothetical protein